MDDLLDVTLDSPENIELIKNVELKALYLELYKCGYAVFKRVDTGDSFSAFCNGAFNNKKGCGDYYGRKDPDLDDFGVNKKFQEILHTSGAWCEWETAESVNVYKDFK